jgi:glyoxylase-like metal-dependent hydrolase (beta-lactamase superfamily II)
MNISTRELLDVNRGLWLWKIQYQSWPSGEGWDGNVVSTCVESEGERILIDPLAPSSEQSGVWTRLDARPPTGVVILKPDHVRDVDLFVRRYNIPAFGPKVFHRDDLPASELRPIQPGNTLPGGLIALYDGRGENETPVWLPHQRTIVFADALTAPEDRLLIWWTPWHEERVLPAMRALLDLPFETVVVSHGEPVHDRKAFEQALKLSPWKV